MSSSHLYRDRWIGDRTERQVQSRITVNCSQPVGKIQEIRDAVAHYLPDDNVIGEEKTDPRVHVVQPGNIVFIDSQETLYGSKVEQQVTVFSTFNGMKVTGLSNDSMRKRYRPYGVALDSGVTENSYKSDRASIAIAVAGTVSLNNNSTEYLKPGQAFTCVPPDVDSVKRQQDLKIALDNSYDQQGEAGRYVGVIKTVGYLDCVTEFSEVVRFLLENVGTPTLSLSTYDRAVRVRETHKFSNKQLYALELKKFLAYSAYTTWHELRMFEDMTPPTQVEARNMAYRLGLLDSADLSMREDQRLQRRLFGRILFGSVELMPDAFKEELSISITTVFPEAASQKATFVMSASDDTSNGREFLRIANEASKGLLTSMVKSLEEIGDSILGIVLTPTEPGGQFDAILTN